MRYRGAAFAAVMVLSTPSLQAQVSVRESFAAASQAEKPATLLWTIEKEPSDVSFGTIEAGVRYSIDLGWLIAGPTLEWHKLTREEKAYDKYSLGTALELFFEQIKLGVLGNPHVDAQVGFTGDRIADKGGLTASGALTLYSNAQWAPGSQTALGGGMWRLRYYPFVGVERHPASSDDVNAVSLGFVQLNMELYPESRVFQLLSSYTIVRELGERGIDGELGRFSVAANVYFDAERHVGVGIEYLDSAQPKEGFARSERTIVGFKVKL